MLLRRHKNKNKVSVENVTKNEEPRKEKKKAKEKGDNLEKSKG